MSEHHPFSRHFTLYVVVGMVGGVIFGAMMKWLPISTVASDFLVFTVLETVGKIFLHLINMLVVPVVFLSLVCGSASLGDLSSVGRMGIKTLALYILTTALAIALALLLAHAFGIGVGMPVESVASHVKEDHLLFHQVILNMFPTNPVRAMAEGNMIQIIVFAILVGITMASFGEKAKNVKITLLELNEIFMRLIVMIMKIAPIGVFCLLSVLAYKVGFVVIQNLMGYFIVVLIVLLIQLFLVYPAFISFIGRLNPFIFLSKMRDALLFAFSVSSSNASIPLMLRTVENKLGVNNAVASFVIPLGATINMDGTAIMQGVATVFIANAYHVHLTLAGYAMVIGMATLASIGTAGVPSVGLITLGMVLQQVGLPLQGIALIIGVDRLLDMARTAVNVAGDAMVSCLVAKSEKALDESVYAELNTD